MIKLYLHLAELPGWQPLFVDAIQRIASSGLVLRADQIYLCCNGNISNFREIIDPLVSIEKKFIIRPVCEHVKKQEWPTLNQLKIDVDESNSSDYIGYAHLKGLSQHLYNSQPAIDWRKYLYYWTLERWEDQLMLLDQGYSTSGVNWLDKPHPHYSGNMWWATSEYIKKLERLPDPDTLVWGTVSKYLPGVRLDPGNYRFEYEAWIGSGDRQFLKANLHSSPMKEYGPDYHYKFEYPEHLYVK